MDCSLCHSSHLSGGPALGPGSPVKNVSYTPNANDFGVERQFPSSLGSSRINQEPTFSSWHGVALTCSPSMFR